MANLYENFKSQSGSRRWFRRAASPTGRSNPPTSEGDHCLGVPLALSPLTVVESPGLRDATQAGERRLVEDPLENPVAAAPLAVVSNPLTGVAGGRHQARVGGEPVGAREGADVAHGHQKLRSEDRPHAWEAGEDPSLGTGVEAPLQFPLEGVEASLEGEHLCGELGDDGSGYVLGGQRGTLALRGCHDLLGEGVRLSDAALLEVSGDPFAPRPADGVGAMVTGDQFERPSAVEV